MISTTHPGGSKRHCFHPPAPGAPRRTHSRGAAIAAGRKSSALFVAGQNGADFIGFGQGLVQLHTRAAGISEDGLDTFALERFDQDFAAQHGATNLGAFSGGACFHGLSCIAHNFLYVDRQPGNKKTHSRFQPWVLVENLFIRDKRQRRRSLRRPELPGRLVE